MDFSSTQVGQRPIKLPLSEQVKRTLATWRSLRLLKEAKAGGIARIYGRRTRLCQPPVGDSVQSCASSARPPARIFSTAVFPSWQAYSNIW